MFFVLAVSYGTNRNSCGSAIKIPFNKASNQLHLAMKINAIIITHPTITKC